MNDLLTSAQMRAIEQAAFETGAATGLELMERAGQGAVDAIFDARADLIKGERSAVILCGPGNNGGDGFVIARLLRQRGWVVRCFLYGDPEKLPVDCRTNFELWKDLGPVSRFPDWDMSGECPDLLIDALFGTGLTRPMGLDLASKLVEIDNMFPQQGVFRVAVDAPSGLCMDSGRVLVDQERRDAAAILPWRNNLTVSFHSRKLGHVLADGPDWCGPTRVASIGLDQRRLRTSSASLRNDLGSLVTEADVDPGQIAKGGPDHSAAHKYSYGHALILSGGPGKTGAARLAARGALRVGAGLVTLAAPGTALTECAAHLTAIMLTRCNGASELGNLLDDERLNALCLGPGLGLGSVTRDLVVTALGSRRRCVLDADALTSFSDEPRHLFGHLHSKVVLTPHAGEFARLFPDIAQRMRDLPSSGPAMSKVDATREAATRAGCTILFKGADTVVAEPGGRCVVSAAVHERAAPWLATAGAGDVLAGMVAGLMARDFWPVSAAGTAAWLHVEAARHFGPGLTADDLPEAIPGVLRKLDA